MNIQQQQNSSIVAHIAVVAVLTALSACSKAPPTFEKMSLQEGESGIVPHSAATMQPEVGQITYERSGPSVKAFTRVKLECPQHASRSLTGIEYKPDKLVLCYDLILDSPGQETSLNGKCPQDLLLQFEILGMPAEVEPKFELRHGCAPIVP